MVDACNFCCFINLIYAKDHELQLCIFFLASGSSSLSSYKEAEARAMQHLVPCLAHVNTVLYEKFKQTVNNLYMKIVRDVAQVSYIPTCVLPLGPFLHHCGAQVKLVVMEILQGILRADKMPDHEGYVHWYHQFVINLPAHRPALLCLSGCLTVRCTYPPTTRLPTGQPAHLLCLSAWLPACLPAFSLSLCLLEFYVQCLP